jgi:hypothetical protein
VIYKDLNDVCVFPYKNKIMFFGWQIKLVWKQARHYMYEMMKPNKAGVNAVELQCWYIAFSLLSNSQCEDIVLPQWIDPL